MTRILIRSPHSPFISSRHERAILRNEINSNTGNLLFPYSISRALMVPGTEIDFVRSCPKVGRHGRDAKRADEKYDCFVIPLANAFRSSFVPEMERIADFIEHVEMPCVVVGVGLQAKASSDGSKDRSFDQAVRHFMSVVLEKSDCVGVRGATTGAYLERLGFVADRDFSVIGCPSMYLYGPELPFPRPFELSSETRISVNCKATLPRKIHRYLRKVTRAMPDFHYAVQNTYELASLHYGLNLRETHPRGAELVLPRGYPTGRDNRAIQEGRVVGFVDVPSWFEYLQGKELSFGTRIHGNIAAILSGTPAFIVAPDSRVLELADYHAIPHIELRTLKRSQSVFGLLEGVDFNQVLKGHEARFQHYLDFLHRNGLRTMFDDDYSSTRSFPFDERMKRVKPSGTVTMKEKTTSLDRTRLRLYGNARRFAGIVA